MSSGPDSKKSPLGVTVDHEGGKFDDLSTPRKKLMEAKMQAAAIDEEVCCI